MWSWCEGGERSKEEQHVTDKLVLLVAASWFDSVHWYRTVVTSKHSEFLQGGVDEDEQTVKPKIYIGAIFFFANNAGKKPPETLQLISLVIVFFCMNSVRTWREKRFQEKYLQADRIEF